MRHRPVGYLWAPVRVVLFPIVYALRGLLYCIRFIGWGRDSANEEFP